MKKTIHPDILAQFADKLLAEKGITGLDAEVAAQLRTDLVSRLEDRVNAVIANNVPEDKVEEFEAAMDSGEAAISDFYSRYIPNLEQLIAAELVRFAQVY